MTDPVRLGVAGLGSFGRLHAATILGISDAQLAAAVDPRPEAFEWVRQHDAHVPCFTSLEQALAEVDAEAWVVASSNSSHIPLATLLLKHGRKVLLEKPLA